MDCSQSKIEIRMGGFISAWVASEGSFRTAWDHGWVGFKSAWVASSRRGWLQTSVGASARRGPCVVVGRGWPLVVIGGRG